MWPSGELVCPLENSDTFRMHRSLLPERQAHTSRSRLLSFAALPSVLGTASATESAVHKCSVKKSLKGVQRVSRGEGGSGGTKPQRPSEVRMDMHREAVMGLAKPRGTDPMVKHITSFTGKGRGGK